MASIISPKAEVSPKAKIGDNCKIYPFAYIEDDVVIGDNCTIYPFVSIMNGTRMGNNNKVFQAAVIAALPQDFHFTGEESEVVIGDNNTIRENVVINRGTRKGGKTVLGNNNFLMEGAHVSHDTVIGNGCVFGYGTKIAGDCVIGNGVIYSTSVVENAKTRVGDLAMIQAGTTFSKDIPPYIIAGGKPVKYAGPNTIIMEQLSLPRRFASILLMPTDWYSMVRHPSSMPLTRSRIRCQMDRRFRTSSSSWRVQRRVSSLRCKDCVDVGIFSSLILYL
mgnify:CR=1 FL=1